MKKLILALGMILISNTSFAIMTGNIDKLSLGVGYGDNILVALSNTTGTDDCGATGGYQYIFDGTTTVGKSVYALLLSAQATGTTVKFSGAVTGSPSGPHCSSQFSQTQWVNWVEINP